MKHVRAAAEPAVTRQPTVLGDLPEWDLSDLYPGRDSEALTPVRACRTSPTVRR